MATLWSLWDMLKFKAKDFYEVTTEIQATLTAIRDKKSIEELPDGSASINPIHEPIFVNIMKRRCEKLQESLAVLGAPITSLAVDELKDDLADESGVLYESLKEGFKDIDRTLKRELTRVTLLALSPAERDWFEPRDPLFGKDFSAKFQSVGVFELDEAAKCLAVGRPTAAVFHLMRLMEVGIRATARCLNVPDPLKPAERNWGNILKAIGTAIEQRWPKASDRAHGDGALFESLHASLDAVRNPWRSGVIHSAIVRWCACGRRILAPS